MIVCAKHADVRRVRPAAKKLKMASVPVATKNPPSVVAKNN